MQILRSLPLLALFVLRGTLGAPAFVPTDAAPAAERSAVAEAGGHDSPLLAERAPESGRDTTGEGSLGLPGGPLADRLRPPPAHDRSSPRRLAREGGCRAGFPAHPPTGPPHEA